MKRILALLVCAVTTGACTNPFTRPLPEIPPHDIVIGYTFSNSMAAEWAAITVTRQKLHYQWSNRTGTEDEIFPLESEQFEALYRAVRRQHPETLHSVERSHLSYDFPTISLQINSGSASFTSTARIDGWTTLPDRQNERFNQIASTIEGLSRKIVDPARRRVSVCADTGSGTKIEYLNVARSGHEPSQGSSACLETALLDGGQYKIEIIYSTPADRYARGSFILEPGIRALHFIRDHDELRIERVVEE